MRAVLDLIQRPAQVLRQVHPDAVRDIGGGRQHDGAGLDLMVDTVLAVADDDGVPLVHDLLHRGAELDAFPQGGGDRTGQRGRAADDPPVEPLPDAQHQAEVPDAGPGRDLVHVTGRPGDGGLEQRGRVLREVADVVEEGPVVLEVVDALLAHGPGLPGALAHHPGVLGHPANDLHPGPHRVEAGGQGHRDAQRVGGDVSLADELPVHGQPLQGPGDLHGRHTGLGEQRIGGGPWAGEDVTAPVQPVVPAALGADPPPDTVLGLQHQGVPVPQPPGRGQTGQTGTDDDYIFHGTAFRSTASRTGSPPARTRDVRGLRGRMRAPTGRPCLPWTRGPGRTWETPTTLLLAADLSQSRGSAQCGADLPTP